jgi:hypothetical protein
LILLDKKTFCVLQVLCPTYPGLAQIPHRFVACRDAFGAASRRDPGHKSLTPILVVRLQMMERPMFDQRSN